MTRGALITALILALSGHVVQGSLVLSKKIMSIDLRACGRHNTRNRSQIEVCSILENFMEDRLMETISALFFIEVFRLIDSPR